MDRHCGKMLRHWQAVGDWRRFTIVNDHKRDVLCRTVSHGDRRQLLYPFLTKITRDGFQRGRDSLIGKDLCSSIISRKTISVDPILTPLHDISIRCIVNRKTAVITIGKHADAFFGFSLFSGHVVVFSVRLDRPPFCFVVWFLVIAL